MTPLDTVLAEDLDRAMRDGTALPCPSAGDPDFDIARAYAVQRAITDARRLAGARIVGRKMGFTNARIQRDFGVATPFWAPVFDTSLADPAQTLRLRALAEPRIEPEIVLRLGRAPVPGLDEAGLIACVDGVALGFEIVQSPFAGWRFAAADCIAALGLHGRLVTGPFMAVEPWAGELWAGRLRGFSMVLSCDEREVSTGGAGDILGSGPLAALARLVEMLAGDAAATPLRPGEVISTGSVTAALRIAAGETWAARVAGMPLADLTLTLA